MTQEEKDLLLKDLCARFAYDLKVSEYFEKTKIWTNPRDFEDVGPYYILKRPEKIKPYLRPMSSMTEDEDKERISLGIWIRPTDGCKVIRIDNMNGVDWLNKHHFDYRGLIEIGLALEAPEGMYNAKQQ